MKILSKLYVSAAIFVAAGMGFVAAPAVYANLGNCRGAQCVNVGVNQTQTGTNTTTLERTIQSITNILLFLVGALSVIMLIVGGLRYTTSNGNPEQIKAAKNTIMYAIIGIVVALLAYAIVAWVVRSLTA